MAKGMTGVYIYIGCRRIDDIVVASSLDIDLVHYRTTFLGVLLLLE